MVFTIHPAKSVKRDCTKIVLVIHHLKLGQRQRTCRTRLIIYKNRFYPTGIFSDVCGTVSACKM